MLLDLTQLRMDYKATYRKNWPLASKIEILIEITKIEMKYQDHPLQGSKRVEIARILQAAGKSLRTMQRWKKLYREQGLEGISPLKRGHPARKFLSKAIQSLITKWREKYRWGSEVIQAHLRCDHSLIANRYQIDRFLKESGLRERYPCTTIKKVKAKRKKHNKKVIVPHPGDHTQMDIKYQLHLLQNKSKAYVYNFIDHASNWSYKRAYSRISAANTEDFMKRLIQLVPFIITRLQTDNDIAFTFKWTSKHPDDPKEHPLFKFCHQKSINHKLIPPGEKELQGLVERSHRQDDQELFSRISPENLKEFNELLDEYCLERNEGRRFKKLSWLSPNQWLECYFENVITFPALLEWKPCIKQAS